MAKRKTTDSEVGGAPATRRSTRLKTTTKEEPILEEKPVKATKAKATKATVKASPVQDEQTEGDEKKVKINNTLPAKTNGAAEVAEEAPQEAPQERQYWLMKAEPESRLEKGHDVKFSIDDLAAKTEPEAWDGIRSYAARNNLRAMKKGDLAFFYHSSCKTPAIVGVMEIVQEHSPDLTAQDPTAAYYDPKDTSPSNPRWSVVHVVFKEKFKNPVTLRTLKDRQLREELRDLQLLKQSRLSVSKVTSGEWEFLNGIVREGWGEGGEVVVDL